MSVLESLQADRAEIERIATRHGVRAIRVFGSVDLGGVWDIVGRDIPELKRRLRPCWKGLHNQLMVLPLPCAWQDPTANHESEFV